MHPITPLVLLLSLIAMLTGCGGGDQPADTRQILKSQYLAQSAIADGNLVLPNNREQYLITTTTSGYIITAIPDDGSSYSVGNQRRIQFADTSVALDLDSSGQLYRLYQAAFDRKPDPSGLGFWLAALDAGTTLQQIADAFVKSDEFQRLYGSAPTNQQFLTKLYNNVLHRLPDASGLAFWLEAMQNGMSKPAALLAFSESPENTSQLAPAIQSGIAYAQSGLSYRPVANAGADKQTTVGVNTVLDGSASTDANGDPLSFSWSLSKPNGSNAILYASSTAKPYFFPDLAATYTATLTVSDGKKSGLPVTINIQAAPIVVAPIADTGIFKCSQISFALAQSLFAAGHTYLDRDHDGKPCEANDIAVEKNTPVISVPSTPPPSSTGRCWVNGYTRKNGTYVSGYWRSC
jgi:hypothetical protein